MKRFGFSEAFQLLISSFSFLVTNNKVPSRVDRTEVTEMKEHMRSGDTIIFLLSILETRN